MVDSAWWTITFTNTEAHIPSHLLGVPLIPAQLLAAGLSAFIFIIMLALHRHFPRVGQAVFFYLASENVARIVVDFFRGDRGDLYPVVFGLQFSQFQLYSAAFLLVCLAGFIGVSVWGRRVKQ